VESLLHVVRHLSGLRGDIRLVIVGEGSELEHLRNLAEKLGIAQLVSFAGFVQKPDIPRYMANADVFLFPTRFDIWGLVLVEAMAAGLPCIASLNAGATHDLVEEGVTGFAADFDDAEYVAGKIHWLLENPQIASKIGRNAADMIKSSVCLEKSAAGFVRGIMAGLNR
jgi:glycosyltransferase involved in cell wall biosynthesis